MREGWSRVEGGGVASVCSATLFNKRSRFLQEFKTRKKRPEINIIN